MGTSRRDERWVNTGERGVTIWCIIYPVVTSRPLCIYFKVQGAHQTRSWLCKYLRDGIDYRLGIPVGVEIVGEGKSDDGAVNVPLVEEGCSEVSLVCSLFQHFPGDLSHLQLLTGLSFVISDDLVVGLETFMA